MKAIQVDKRAGSLSCGTLCALVCATGWADTAPQCGEPARRSGGSFNIEDYFRLARVTELALSPDGRILAYVIETHSPDGNGLIRAACVASLSHNGGTVAPEPIADGSGFSWIPRTHELAFISARSGTPQLFSYQVSTGRIQQRTHTSQPVETFRFAADGMTVAYTTRAPANHTASLYDELRTGNTGILIDTRTVSSHDFLNPDWSASSSPPNTTLWLAHSGRAPVKVPVPGTVAEGDRAYFWSSDSSRLSVTYVASNQPFETVRDDQTSLGVFDRRTGLFSPLAEAIARNEPKPGVRYAGGEWIPGTHALLIRRVKDTDPWVSPSYPDWTVTDASGPVPANEAAWHPIETFPRGLAFWPKSASQVLFANTSRAVHSLFVLNTAQRSPVVEGLDGSSTLFGFNDNFSVAAFVNESLTRPPEIYLRRAGHAPVQLTHLNTAIARQIPYSAREVHWTSTDGTTISGWLLEPAKFPSMTPGALITHIHGGPSYPFPNAFAPYFTYWPYPLEVYAAHGMSVFLPNYRGTSTYGREIEEAADTNTAAIDDILTGIRALIASGVADSARLGISGHSHGAWLGPLSMTRGKLFRASSFAEGVGNSVVMYELMSEEANREIHDTTIGVSLYEDPQRYISQSPDLQFAGMSTASLFEGGARTAALFMLGFSKAAHRFGMPTEFIVYPRTAHNLVIPAMQREAAERNLDWFDFWLNGRENPGPQKVDQYARWKRMKTDWDSTRQGKLETACPMCRALPSR